jgi:hypothetical protein
MQMKGNKHRDHSDHVSLVCMEIRETNYGVGSCWVLGRPAVALMAEKQKWVTSPQEAGRWLVRKGLTPIEADTFLGEFVLTYCTDEAWHEAINELSKK